MQKRRRNSSAPIIFRARWAQLTRFNNTIDETGSRNSNAPNRATLWPSKTTCPVFASCPLQLPRVIHRCDRTPKIECRATNFHFTPTRFHDGFLPRRLAAMIDEKRRDGIADGWRARNRGSRRNARHDVRECTGAVGAAAPPLTRTTMRRRTAALSAGRSGK